MTQCSLLVIHICYKPSLKITTTKLAYNRYLIILELVILVLIWYRIIGWNSDLVTTIWHVWHYFWNIFNRSVLSNFPPTEGSQVVCPLRIWLIMLFFFFSLFWGRYSGWSAWGGGSRNLFWTFRAKLKLGRQLAISTFLYYFKLNSNCDKLIHFNFHILSYILRRNFLNYKKKNI